MSDRSEQDVSQALAAEDAIYPLNLADDTGKPLDGGGAYVLHFDKDAMPPVDAFERGKSFDIDKVDPAIKTGLTTAPEDPP